MLRSQCAATLLPTLCQAPPFLSASCSLPSAPGTDIAGVNGVGHEAYVLS